MFRKTYKNGHAILNKYSEHNTERLAGYICVQQIERFIGQDISYMSKPITLHISLQIVILNSHFIGEDGSVHEEIQKIIDSYLDDLLEYEKSDKVQVIKRDGGIGRIGFINGFVVDFLDE